MSVSFAGESFDSKLMKKVGECKAISKTGKTVRKVFVIKQWHLSPGTDTQGKDMSLFPQEKNQYEIYQQLSSWLDHHELSAIVAEGCEGLITEQEKARFNGWTLDQLRAKSKSKDYDHVLTHTVFKVYAKWGADAHVLCGDSTQEIKKANEALSDARADIGYYSRIDQLKDQPEKLKSYLEGAIDAYHLSKSAKVPDVQSALVRDLKGSIAKVDAANQAREKKLVEVLKESKASSSEPNVMAVVYGGIHAQGIQKQLENEGFACEVLEPLDYQNQEESLLLKLREMLEKLK